MMHAQYNSTQYNLLGQEVMLLALVRMIALVVERFSQCIPHHIAFYVFFSVYLSQKEGMSVYNKVYEYEYNLFGQVSPTKHTLYNYR